MKRLLAGLLMVLVWTSSCREKKKPSLSGESNVDVSDFIASYPSRSPVVSFDEAVLRKKENDSLRISYHVFTQFVPDSVIKKVAGKNSKPAIFPLAAIVSKDGEQFLFSNLILPGKRVLLVTCFDKKNKFDAARELMVLENKPALTQVITVDRGYVLTKTVSRKNPDGSTAEGKDSYVYDPSLKNFSLIMTEPLDDKIKEVVNPIDTLPVKNKYSGDYVKDKLNMVSVRDGKKQGKILFFIHFDKGEDDCTGEMRGEAKFISPSRAVYTKAGDGCQLEFIFGSSSVSLKELTPCGNWRGVMCAFDAAYPKKKLPKSNAKKK